MPSPIGRALRLLDHPRASWAIVLAAVLLSLPTLGVGFFLDDWGHLAVLDLGWIGGGVSSLDLYRFVSADRAEVRALMDFGPLPWWTDAALRVHLFRPLTSLTLVLDHAVWGRAAAGYHASSIVLYVLVILAVISLYRRLSPPGAASTVAVLAALIFALDGRHAQILCWTASRHLFVGAAPAIAGLAAHLAWLRGDPRARAWLGPLGLGAGLLASESALGAAAYWIAHAALGPRSPRGRLVAAAPALAVTGAYTLVYKLLGFGVRGSGAYIDPGVDPLRFLDALARRAPLLLAEALTLVPADMSHVLAHAIYFAAAAAGIALLVALARAVLPAIPEGERAALRWLLPGAFGALAVTAGGFVSGRLLLFPGIGIAYLIAVLLVRGVERAASLARSRALRAGLAILAAVNVILAPLSSFTAAYAFGSLGDRNRAVAEAADLPTEERAHVVVVAASDPGVSFYIPLVRARDMLARKTAWHVLSMAKAGHRVTRTAPDALRVEVIDGRMLDTSFQSLFRREESAFHPGDRVTLAGLSITIVAVDRGKPTAIEARFDASLDDARLRVLAWRDGRLARLPLRVGESVDIPWSPGPFRFF